MGREGRQKSLHGKLKLPVQVKVLFGVSNSRSPARLQRAQVELQIPAGRGYNLLQKSCNRIGVGSFAWDD